MQLDMLKEKSTLSSSCVDRRSSKDMLRVEALFSVWEENKHKNRIKNWHQTDLLLLN